MAYIWIPRTHITLDTVVFICNPSTPTVKWEVETGGSWIASLASSVVSNQGVLSQTR